jgi:hypothetical protein
MRLSEKTLELNFCSQLPWKFGAPLIWFGLTQREEARLGFDACTAIGGRLVIFQFKASSWIMASGARRFHLPHLQLLQLQGVARRFPRSVFYVFPLVGTDLELISNPDVVVQSWLLDVGLMPAISLPTTSAGLPRRSGIHYADVLPGNAVIHSEPVQAELVSAAVFAERRFPDARGINWMFETFDSFWNFAQIFRRRAVGCIIGPTSRDGRIA